MIWALLFIALMAVLGGDSPFVVPHLDKYVKTHVVDKTKRDKVLEIISEAKKKRKEVVKKEQHLLKELHGLASSRDSKTEDFKDLGKRILITEEKSQNSNLKVNVESQKYITPEEWIKISEEIFNNFDKIEKENAKKIEQAQKVFVKWKAKISKNVADASKQKQALEAVDKLEKVYIGTSKRLLKEILDKESMMYKYEASEKELLSLQKELMDMLGDVYRTNMETHFALVKATTEEEWKKIN